MRMCCSGREGVSLLAQRHDRVDPHRAAGRQIARQNRDGDERRYGGRVGERIAGADAEEESLNLLRCRGGSGEAQHKPDRS
jgi:hypothetical protein